MNKTVLFDANPSADTRKTGVGYYLEHLLQSLPLDKGLQYRGYYFDFLGHGHKENPIAPGVIFHKIKLVPGKLLSVTRRLGFQPPIELFTPTSSDIIFYTNYVALPSLHKRKVALAVYDLGFLDCPDFTQPVNLKYLSSFCPRSIRRADLIITISEFTKQQLRHHFPNLKADIVVTPIPPVAADISSQHALGKRLSNLGVKQKQYILFLSTIEPRKNVANLVKAYAALPSKLRSKYSLVLAGGKGWKDEAILEAIQKAQKAGCNIILTGYISENEKTALYQHAAGFVLPSHYEGFGMPVLEAMQYGLPVAVSDIPVFHEVAGKAALYFDKDDVSDMSQKLATLLSDTAVRARLVKAGPAQLASFSWQHNAMIVSDALAKLAG